MKERRLRSEVVSVASLRSEDIRRLFEIFVDHYDHVDWQKFVADLHEKDFVILLRGTPDEDVRGFSTQKIISLTVRDVPIRAVFSGDTIIGRDYWGEQELVRSWCSFVGQVRSEEPEVRLFWFLISKGYRTYLYLPLFFREYFPCYDSPTPLFQKRVMDALGHRRYRHHYDSESGLIEFAESQGQLVPELAVIPKGRQDDPHVQFFLSRNPRFAQGSELVCLAEISPTNMKSFAARFVAEGERKGLRLAEFRVRDVAGKQASEG